MTKTPLPVPQWYAVHTAAGVENKVVQKLGRAGYWTWFPFDRYRRKRRRPGGRDLVEWVARPHFSRYVFACLRFTDESIGPINDMDGVSRVVCERFSGRPVCIPGTVMDALMKIAMVTLDDEKYPELHTALMREVAEAGDATLTMLVNDLGFRVIRRGANAA